MKILISGSSGLIGADLCDRLIDAGHQVVRLVRSRKLSGEDLVFWDPESGDLEAEGVAGVDAVVHLAGENIAAGRWDGARKARILASREKGTKLLALAAARMDPMPKTFISASATGYYGNRGDEILTEESSPGQDFLADVCRTWERSTEAAAIAGIRVVRLRFGVVLSPLGGALKKMLPPFRFGLGGPIAGGRQWMSWIALEDAVAAILHALERSELTGAVNVVSPNPVQNSEFTRALSRVLRRPAVIPIPGLAIKAQFGEMGEATVLSSARALPGRLEKSGFTFRFPELEGALADLLGS